MVQKSPVRSGGSANVYQSGYGVGGGVDYQVTPQALIGAALGGGASTFSVRDRATTGSVDAFHAGVYGAWREEHFFASGIVSFDLFDNAESRLATIPGVMLPPSQFIDGPYYVPGFRENLKGSFGATSISGHFEAGYRNDLGAVRLTPFAGLEFGSLNTNGFTENNSDSLSVIGLSYAGQNIVSVPSFLGLQLDGKFDLSGGGVFAPWVRAAWKHEFDIGRFTDSSFISAPGFEFRVRGAQPPRDAALTNIGAKFTLDDELSIFANFNGEFGAGSRGYAGMGGVSLEW